MRIESEFTVSHPVDHVWERLDANTPWHCASWGPSSTRVVEPNPPRSVPGSHCQQSLITTNQRPPGEDLGLVPAPQFLLARSGVQKQPESGKGRWEADMQRG